jgi:hypothetical protein
VRGEARGVQLGEHLRRVLERALEVVRVLHVEGLEGEKLVKYDGCIIEPLGASIYKRTTDRLGVQDKYPISILI